MPQRRRTHDPLSLPRLGRATAAVAVCLVALAVLMPVAGSADAGACTVTWNGGAGNGRWHDPDNWDARRVPDESDEACIGHAAVVEVTTDVAVGGLQLDGELTVADGLRIAGTRPSAVAGTLIVAGGRLRADGDLTVATLRESDGSIGGSGTVTTPDFTWTGGSQVGTGATEIVAGPGLNLSGGIHTVDVSRRLRIDAGATALWTAGDLELRADSRLENAGLIDVRGDQDLSGCCGQATWVNEPGGTIRKSEGAGVTRLGYGWANDGAIEVRSGTLSIEGDGIAGRSSGGAFDMADGTTLRFLSASTLGPTSTVTGPGRVLFSEGLMHLQGAVAAPVVVDGDAAQAFFDGVAAPSSIELARGFLGGSGRVRTPDLRWTGGYQTGFGVTEIAPGGAGLTISGGGEHGIYERELSIESGAVAAWTGGTIAMTETGSIENSGLFDIRDDLSFSGCCDSRPHVHNAGGGTIRKSGGSGRASITYSLSNDGTIEVDSGSLALDGGLTNYDGASLTGGTYRLMGRLELPAARVLRNAASVRLDGPDSGIQDLAGHDGLTDLAENASAGDLTLLDGRGLHLSSGFSNAGSVTIGERGTVEAAGPYRQTAGATTLASATSTLRADRVAIDGGFLRGAGIVNSSSLENAGSVEPGLPVGILTVTGDYRQDAAGTLSMQIGGRAAGDQYDRLDVRGSAVLAGALRIETEDGFSPSPEDAFELIRHSSEAGEFDEVQGLAPDEARPYWPPEYVPDGVWLRRGATPRVSIDDTSVTEGDAGDSYATFAVHVDPAPTRTVQLAWRTTGGSAATPDDYDAATGTLAIPHGQASAEVRVAVHGDAVDEPDEGFGLNLSEPVWAEIERGDATATIVDDDTAVQPPPPGGGPPPVHHPPPPPHRPGPSRPPVRPVRPPACVDAAAPRTRFRRGHRPVRVSRRRLLARGSAHDRGCGSVRRVAVAIARRQRGHRARCRFLKQNGRLGRPRSCRRPRWLAARGTTHWRLKKRARLPRGSYLTWSRAIDTAGNREHVRRHPARGRRNPIRFRVRFRRR